MDKKAGRQSPGRMVLIPAESTLPLDEKKVDPFALTKSWQRHSRMLWLSPLDWKPARRVTLSSQKGDPPGKSVYL